MSVFYDQQFYPQGKFLVHDIMGDGVLAVSGKLLLQNNDITECIWRDVQRIVTAHTALLIWECALITYQLTRVFSCYALILFLMSFYTKLNWHMFIVGESLVNCLVHLKCQMSH